MPVLQFSLSVYNSRSFFGSDGDQPDTPLCGLFHAFDVPQPVVGNAIFPSVAIPQGSTIDSATLEMTLYPDVTTAIDLDFYLSLQAADNARLQTTAADFIAAARTTPTYEIAHGDSSSFDITAAVQAVINRAGWASGNNLGLILDLTNPASVPASGNYGDARYITANDITIVLTINYGTNVVQPGGAALLMRM